MLPGLARSRRGVFALQPRSPMSQQHGRKRADATTPLTADCDPAGGSGDAGNLEPGNSSKARAGATTKQLLRPRRQDKQTYACPGVDITLNKQKKIAQSYTDANNPPLTAKVAPGNPYVSSVGETGLQGATFTVRRFQSQVCFMTI